MVMRFKRTGTVFAGAVLTCVMALCYGTVVANAAARKGFDDRSVRRIMEDAWAITPHRFTFPDGRTIVVDKKKKDQVMVPIATAREVILVGRLTAHAEACGLVEEHIINHRVMMSREAAKKKWTEQQLLYINMLHLFTVKLLNNRIQVMLEKDGRKVMVRESKSKHGRKCTDNEKKVIVERILAYINIGRKKKLVAKPGGKAAAPPTKAKAAPKSKAAPIKVKK